MDSDQKPADHDLQCFQSFERKNICTLCLLYSTVEWLASNIFFNPCGVGDRNGIIKKNIMNHQHIQNPLPNR